MNDYRTQSPRILRDFLIYHETICGHSKNTVNEYFLDLRTFLRYIKVIRNLVPRDTELEEIDIMDVDIDFIKQVTLMEVYEYLSYLSRNRIKNKNADDTQYGLTATTRARKISSIRSFFKYLTVKVNLLEDNPLADLDSPKTPKSLPRYLTLDESQRLLKAIEGKNKDRDYCIICLFLNCGLRISEIVGLNLTDIKGEALHITGKGNKQRVVFLNDACIQAIDLYMSERKLIAAIDKNALFLSNRRKRMSTDAVHAMVKKTLNAAGLDASKYSSHKLRHTAATLMLSNGVDVRTLQELLGHDNLNTTQIYTHVDSAELRIAAAANPLSAFMIDEE